MKRIITNLDLLAFNFLNGGIAFGPRLPNVFLYESVDQDYGMLHSLAYLDVASESLTD